MQHSEPSDDATSAADFLAEHHPFDQLPATVLNDVASHLKDRRVKAGSRLLSPEDPVSYLQIIRHGLVEIRDSSGELLAHLGPGDVFGHESLASGDAAGVCATTLEDSHLHLMTQERFDKLCQMHPPFRYFLAPRAALVEAARANAPGDGDPGVSLLHTPVERLLARAPVTVPPDTPIQDAAQTMTREGISSLLVVDDGVLAGILTDRDLRSRVTAQGRDVGEPVARIMSPRPTTIDASGYTYEAMLMMARSHFHHLPVMDGERLVGMLTDTDLLERHSTSPLSTVGDVHRCTSPEELATATANLRRLLTTLVDANASSYSIGRVISSVGEAVNSRLLTLAEERLGPPPVPYAWMTGGSLGRMEQTALSDQDNCLLLDDRYDEAQHGAYFRDMADWVCDALDGCGYVYCPGEIMARTDRWRQPLKVWRGYFDRWIDQPEPKALMHASIFFDLRRLHGDSALFQELFEYVRTRAQENRIFHAYMMSNALTHEPPLGFFGNFVRVKDGEHDRTLDLKHNGVIPIVDIARIVALVAGSSRVNTDERLEEAQEQGAISSSGAADLRGALEFIATVRLRHQARQIRDGEAPDNFVSPEVLSSFERNHLKDAFGVVRTIQQAMSQRYQAGRLG